MLRAVFLSLSLRQKKVFVMKKNLDLFATLSLLASMSFLCGCNDEEYGYTAQQIAYETAFRRQFPNMDVEHTWCTAVCQELTVTTDVPSDIYVFALSGRHLYAHYSDVMGTRTLVYDANGSDEQVFVSNGRVSRLVPVGGNASFADGGLTRAGENDVLTQDIAAIPPAADPYYFFFEDLGADSDLDFNDVVLKVEYTCGQTTMRVTLVAAGGTLAVEPQYDGSACPWQNASQTEAHRAFRELNESVVSLDDVVEPMAPINVTGVAEKGPLTCTECPYFETTVPETFSVSRNKQLFTIALDNGTISGIGSGIPKAFAVQSAATNVWNGEGAAVNASFLANWIEDQDWYDYIMDGGITRKVLETPWFYAVVPKDLRLGTDHASGMVTIQRKTDFADEDVVLEVTSYRADSQNAAGGDVVSVDGRTLTGIGSGVAAITVKVMNEGNAYFKDAIAEATVDVWNLDQAPSHDLDLEDGDVSELLPGINYGLNIDKQAISADQINSTTSVPRHWLVTFDHTISSLVKSFSLDLTCKNANHIPTHFAYQKIDGLYQMEAFASYNGTDPAVSISGTHITIRGSIDVLNIISSNGIVLGFALNNSSADIIGGTLVLYEEAWNP